MRRSAFRRTRWLRRLAPQKINVVGLPAILKVTEDFSALTSMVKAAEQLVGRYRIETLTAFAEPWRESNASLQAFFDRDFSAP